MEHIIFKAPNGTKRRLRRINPNLSALLRDQIERLLDARPGDSVHDRTARLCGIIKTGRRDVATGREYLKQYGPKRPA